MFKNKRLRRLVSLFLILLIGAGIYYYRQEQYRKKVEARIAEVKKIAKEQKVTESDFPGIHIATSSQQSDDFRRFVQKPVFESDELNKEIDRFVEENVEQFNSSVEETVKKVGTDKLTVVPSLIMNFEIYLFGDDFYSIVFYIEEFLGGNTEDSRSKVYLVDLVNQEFLDPETLINAKDKNTVLQLVNDHLAQQEEISDFFFEDYFKDSISVENLFDKMYFTNQLVVFLFDKYTVAAGAAGTPVVNFSRDSFQKYLDPNFRATLGYVNQVVHQGNVTGADRWDTIKKPHVITNNPAAGKKVALTFDDGPHPQNTQAIMELLEQYHAKATFFMLGTNVNFYPEIVARVIKAGHEIGEHSWSHPDFTTLDAGSIQQQLEKSDAAFQKVTPWTPTLFRPPYGAYNEAVSQALGNRHIVLWSIDTLDWQSHDPQAILAQVKNDLHDGAIILMHDVHDTTVPAVALVLEYLQSQGYEMVTVSELFK